jgi:hypothetical protein
MSHYTPAPNTPFRPVVIEGDGVFGQLREGGILSIGGTSFPNFTVGGRGLLFDDGTSTSGSASQISLQTAYEATPAVGGSANITLGVHKDFSILNHLGTVLFTVDAETGTVLIGGVSVVTLNTTVEHHLSGTPGYRHLAGDVDIIPIASLPGVSDVQAALTAINTKVDNNLGAVKGYEHTQIVASDSWIVIHAGNSFRTQVTVYDSAWDQIIPNNVKIVDANSMLVSFSSPVAGKAMVLLF